MKRTKRTKRTRGDQRKQRKENLLHNLEQIREQKGAKGLLPQNLPDFLFYEVFETFKNFDPKVEEQGVWEILVYLCVHYTIGNSDKGEITRNDFLKGTECVVANFDVEYQRRKGFIELAPKNLPSIENIMKIERFE